MIKNNNLSKVLQSSSNEFFKEGEYWTISYEGNTIRLKDTLGIQYIAYLVHHPNKSFHVMQLINKIKKIKKEGFNKIYEKNQIIEEGLSMNTLYNTDTLIDNQTIGEYKKVLKGLNNELEDARELNKLEKAAEVQEKIKSISEVFTRAFTRSKHLREFDCTAEKARKAVGNNINNSLNKIKKEHYSLWRHFKNSIQLGRFCSYTPERFISWQF